MYDFHAVMRVSQEQHKDITTGILTTAVESGWGDWFAYKSHRDPETAWVLSANVLDIEEGTIHAIGQAKIWAALNAAMSSNLASYLKRDVLQCILDGDAAALDAEGADAIIQLAIFGELVYG